ncbi:MAG TPA: helix-turn-helix domain-containing protein [Candidatus Micrarchaeaceae archaeon]|nr:helix-turn-helix domain-containing protein [Candidatus Micrarchaeaceae archaeon]
MTVTSSQISAGFGISRQQIEDFARSIARRLESEIPAYARVPGSAIEQDLIEVETRNLELYLGALAGGRLPDPAELADLEVASGIRLRQGFPLEAVLRAGRLEAQAMWEIVVAHAPAESLARLATLTMQYLDLLNSVSERGYLHAREDMGRSLEEAIRLFLGRIVSGEFADDADAEGEARLLGYDLSALRIGVVIEAGSLPAMARSVVDMRLADVVRDLRRRFPDSPAGLVDLGVVLAVPGTSADEVARSLTSTIGDGGDGAFHLTAGLGSPRAGAHGMMISLREARRARALGSLLEPQGRVHKYDELRLLDLFKQDTTTDSFVQEVLAPLLGRDQRSRAHIVETLDAFFAAGMVRKAAAAQLGIHPNSLDYRLKMIEVTLGYPVRSGNSAFKLQLALKLLPLTGSEVLRAPREHGPELR